MKKQFLFCGLVSLGCLWYLFAGVSGILLPTTQEYLEEQVAPGGSGIFGEKGILDLHITPWENKTSRASRTISTLVKVAFPLDSHPIILDDSRIVSFFKAYTGYYRILLMRHRKLDSLFPYHYFW